MPTLSQEHQTPDFVSGAPEGCTPADALMLAKLALDADVQGGAFMSSMGGMSRDEYVSRLGNVCIDSGLSPSELPESFAYAWKYAKGLKSSDNLLVDGLGRVLDESLKQVEVPASA